MATALSNGFAPVRKIENERRVDNVAMISAEVVSHLSPEMKIPAPESNEEE